jgi:hypothetical protein
VATGCFPVGTGGPQRRRSSASWRSPTLEGGLRVRQRLARHGHHRALRGRRHESADAAGRRLRRLRRDQRRGLRGQGPTHSCAAHNIRPSAVGISPMVELLGYLEAKGFSNHVVCGSGADFMRPITQEMFGIPRERVIGSTTGLEYAGDEKGGTLTHGEGSAFSTTGPRSRSTSGPASAADRCLPAGTQTAISRCSPSRSKKTSRPCGCSSSTTMRNASSPIRAAPRRRSPRRTRAA